MDDRARQLLRDILHQHREEILEEATDWVRGCAIDLGTKRPREETRKLNANTLSVYEAALFAGDMTLVTSYIEYTTAFRTANEFHVSTLLRGLLSIRWALLRFVRMDIADGWTAFDILSAVDDVYYEIAFQLADAYTAKLNETITGRRAELEQELTRVTEARTRELEEKLAVIESQRRMRAELSSPVIRVWEGVLVAPVVGEMTAARAADLLEKALDAITRSSDDTFILTITGMTSMDPDVAHRLLRLLEAAKLLGTRGILVGMSPAIARTVIELGVDFGHLSAFATLQDGLRVALRARRPTSRGS